MTDAAGDEATGATAACASPEEGPAQALTLAGSRWTLEHGVLRAEARDPDGVARLGIVGDVAAADGAELAALGALVAALRTRRVEALIAPGGLGGGAPGAAARVLDVLVSAGVPVLVGTGATERAGDLAAALGARGAAAFGLARVTRVEGDDFTLVPLSGHALARAVVPGACRAGAAELERAARAAKDAPEPRVLVSHGPPRVGGEGGIDRAGTAVIGAFPVAAWLAASGVRFGVFGDVAETAGTACDAHGGPVAPGAWAAELLLNAGRVDALPPPGKAVPEDAVAARGGVAVASVLELHAGSAGAAPSAAFERVALPVH
ncbi:MAG TPA: hypothetical protein VG389_27730 [Myxococcota bacterium]|jgi:hypothetical protein|nr:hypothetical protein [Myxococcota bacterium]